MGWAIAEREGRHIGYGVPATCDYPGCVDHIDRGLGYACGGGVMGDAENCGLFFCSAHRTNFIPDADDNGGEWFCDRCANDQPPFDPTPDVDEWVQHVLTDDSWAQFRTENPDWRGYRVEAGS